ncbi:hypothetical protein FQA39_LY06789 [Lamprigera yunnana]|nr:hypothetical protein FQA39_LY06789 [Lamprigera yunnana]
MDASADITKKPLVEDLSKEEIIKKYQDLVVILKKAMHNKETLTQENNSLKGKLNESQVKDELIENLTQQKLSFITSIEDLQTQNTVVIDKCKNYEGSLKETNNKVSELEIENESLQRQTQRLTTENEQLLTELDSLEKKREPLEEKLEAFSQQLSQKEVMISELQINNDQLAVRCAELESNIEILEKNYENAQITICELKITIQESTNRHESYLNETDDLNIELHKNKALVEKLQQDLKTISGKFTDKQIELSGYASDLQNANERLKDKLTRFRTKIVKFAADIKTLQQNKIDILSIFKTYTHQVKVWEMELKKLSLKILSEFQKVQLQNSKLEAEFKLQCAELETGKLDNERLLKERANLEYNLLQVKLSETEIQNEMQQVCEKNKILEESVLQNKKVTYDCGNQVNTIDEQLNVVKKENSELLSEMNEMNQVIKSRGEAISKQEKYSDELLSNIRQKDAQILEQSGTIQKKDEQISNMERTLICLRDKLESKMNEAVSSKDGEILQMQNEISLLREKLNTSQGSEFHQDTSYAESETLSTSTISKIEELNRIKDLEGSWEEKYSKLRGLALKLKGKIRDLTEEQSKEHNEKFELQQKLTENMKNCQTLNAQCDKLQDELDEHRKREKENLKKLDTAAFDISNSKKQLVNNDEVITKLKFEIDTLIKEKINMDTWKKQISTKVQNLRKEVDAGNVLKKDFENQISKLNQQVEAKDKLLKEEIEKHNSTRCYLQESNIECKKQTVLNLEIQNYERSLKDLTVKLDKKEELINKLKNQVDSQKGTVNLMKEENKILQEELKNIKLNVNVAQNEVHAYKKSISDLETVIIQKDEKIQNFIETLESCRSKNEELSYQLSKVISENQKNYNTVKEEKDYLHAQNIAFEQKLTELADTLKFKSEELDEVNKEYRGYRVRAKSVLRQHQTRDVGLEEKLSEEVTTLKVQASNVTSELNDLRMKFDKLTSDNALLKVENENFTDRNLELKNSFKKIEKQQEELCTEHQKSIMEHAEAIRELKIHSETLAQCYRQQLSEQEVRHNREIIELQSKVEKNVPLSEQGLPPISSREQGEGSENVNENLMHSIPLNRLLNFEFNQDINSMKKQMSDNETKVSHLTSLLADTEQDLAKHVQMNKLLKEEIRRQQRSVEREKHAENLEYLKNVVFKFATLSGGDERSRLVPVLNTILKFSPEEIHKLNLVARNESRGWSNYIQMWSNKT